MNEDLKTKLEDDYNKMDSFWHKEHESGRKIAHEHGSPPKYQENVTNHQEKTKEDRAERFYLLLDENIKLKTHQAVLDGELTKMNTRLQRIKEMIARERRLNGQNFGKGFDKQIDEIIDENSGLTEENRKLKTVIKGLKNRLADKTKYDYTRPTTTGKKRMVTTQFSRGTNKSKTRGAGKLGGSRGQTVGFAKPLTQDIGDISSIKDKDLVIAKMKESINTGSVTIHTLQNELEKRRNEEVKLKNLVHDLRDQLDDRERQVLKYENDSKDIKSKDLKIVEELNRKNSENQALKAQVAIYESNQGNAKENRKYIQEIIQERDDYQNKLTSLLTDPFFRRESTNEVVKKIHDLEEENKKLKQQLDEIKENAKEKDDELAKLKKEYNVAIDERHHTMAHGGGMYPFKMEGGNVDLAEMKKALMSMDPSVFRATMDHLNYGGEEPIWAKIDFLEQLGIDVNADSKDPKSAARVIELMKQDKRELAAALEKCQQILKLQYDIEKDNKTYYEAESQEQNTRIRELTLKLDDARKIADSRLEEITLLKRTGHIPKSEAGADYEKIDTAESEFSYATLETDLKHEENILDLAIDKAEYYNNSLLQVVESDVVSEKGFLTFFTVEFYDHDVKATDVTSGLEPGYSTLFSFKNKIDDFYIQYLQTNRIKLELFFE